MALILQIETATSVCSVALSKEGRTVAFKEKNEPNIHASQLTLFIEEVLRLAGVSYADLSAIAVSQGPGSYTGLRIGTSTAKGLCYALDIPLIAISTLKAMAAGFGDSNNTGASLLCPMIDARRMEVYMAVFDKDLKTVHSVTAQILVEDTFARYSKILLFGDGAEKCRPLYAEKPNVSIISGFENSARYLSALGYEMYVNDDFQDVAYFEPFYLKDFVAGKPKT